MAGHQRSRLSAAVIALIAGVATPSMSVAADRQCAQRPPTSPAVAELTERFVRDNAAAQGRTIYGGTARRPRPKMSAIDIKRSWAKFVLPAEEWRDQAVMFFTIYDQKLRSTDSEVLNLPFDVYWCLAAKGDIVLISDSLTDHYVRIAAIDRERQTVDLIDRWPNILLDFGGDSVTARIGSVNATLVRFSKPDFAHLFRAAIILDTADFVHALERELPRESWPPELYIAVGRSLLYAGKYKTFPGVAADFIIDGVRAAGRAGRQDLVEETVPAMFAAVAIAHSFEIARGNQDGARLMSRYFSEILTRYKNQPMERLSAEDALRIGFFALDSGESQTALIFLGEAIEKAPRDHRAYFFRAQTWRKIIQSRLANRDEALRAARQAQQDAETALELIAVRERELARRLEEGMQDRGVYWERIDAAQEDEAESVEIKTQREAALRLRDDFRQLIGQLEDAAKPQPPPR